MKYHYSFLYLWLILAAMSISSCMYYMKEESLRNDQSYEDDWLIKKSIYRSLALDNYIVLCYNSEMWHLYDLKLSDDEHTLMAKREIITIAYQNIIDGVQDRKTKAYNKSKKDLINQAHFFVANYDFDAETERVIISVDEILKLEIYQHDVKTSNEVTNSLLIAFAPFIGLPGFIIIYFLASLRLRRRHLQLRQPNLRLLLQPDRRCHRPRVTNS